MGIIYGQLSDYEHALEYFEKALALEEKRGDKNGMAINLGYIGMVYTGLSDYPRGLEYMQKALAIDEELGVGNNLAASLHNIGTVYSNLAEYSRALEYFGKALAMNEKNGNNVWMANNFTHISDIYWQMSNYPLALEYSQKSLAIREQYQGKDAATSALGNIGFIYASMGDYSLALEYMQRALAIFEELGIKSSVALNLQNIGELYISMGDYSLALEYSYKSLAINEAIGLKEMVASNYGNIGTLYALKKFDGYDPKKAEEYLLKSIASYTELGGKQQLPEFYRTLAELYRDEKQWKEADNYFQKYHQLYCEVQSEEAKNAVHKFSFERQAAEREKEIAITKAKAEAEMNATTTLLHKVLPPSIATRLIKGEKIADYFTSISILFADIVGFTPIAAQMPARKVLAFLNYVFGEFDRICESHGCEKIKTIGDGYMAVAGAPIECADHAERITRAAMEMMSDIQLPDDIRSSLPKDAIFNIRIGINSGPAFGGIVGENRFVYDIYSDSVNTAARMESHGEPGKIHVSEDFAFHLQNRMDMVGDDLGGITFEERGEMEIKGKGMMKTYFIEQRRTS